MRHVRLFVIPAVLIAAFAIVSPWSLGGVAQDADEVAPPCPSPMATPEASPAMEPVASPAMEQVASPVAPSEASPAAAVCSITVEGHDTFTFTPSEVVIPADTDVQLIFINTGALEHDFTVDELNIHVAASGGNQASSTINVPAGTYEFYCSVPGHRESGMVGTLTAQ